MVVSGATSREPGGSWSPADRARRKPRQEWLVAIGQGRSPARTLRRESKGSSKNRRSSGRKKFDKARLSFGGLEKVCVCQCVMRVRLSRALTEIGGGTNASCPSPSYFERRLLYAQSGGCGCGGRWAGYIHAVCGVPGREA